MPESVRIRLCGQRAYCVLGVSVSVYTLQQIAAPFVEGLFPSARKGPGKPGRVPEGQRLPARTEYQRCKAGNGKVGVCGEIRGKFFLKLNAAKIRPVAQYVGRPFGRHSEARGVVRQSGFHRPEQEQHHQQKQSRCVETRAARKEARGS